MKIIISLLLLPLLLPVGKCTCPDGWLSHKAKCYLFGEQLMSWASSSSYCHIFGSKLAEPTNSDEFKFLSTEVRKKGDARWFGISDLILENHWLFASSMFPVHTNYFAPGEPSGGLSQNCGAYTPDGTWHDVSCSLHLRCICEKLVVDDSSISVPFIG